MNRVVRKSAKKSFFSSMVLVVLAVIVLMVGCYTYSRTVQHNFQGEIIYTLSEVSTQTAAVIRKEIDASQRILENLALTVSADMLTEEEEMLFLQQIAKRNSFKRMGIVDLEGNAVATDGSALWLGDRDFFSAAIAGKTSVSGVLKDRTDGQNIHVFSAPLYQNNGIYGALFATYDAANFEAMLGVSSFDGKACALLVGQDGDVITHSADGHVQQENNLYTMLERYQNGNAQSAASVWEEIEGKSTGWFRYNIPEPYYVDYRPLRVGDWYLFTFVPCSILDKEMETLVVRSYILNAAIMLVSIGMILVMFLMQREGRRELERVAFVDPLTGGATFSKFKIEAEGQLKKATVGEYALISVDVDKFKYINDLFGYQEGNEVICYLSQLLTDMLGSGELLTHQAADHFLVLLKTIEQNRLEKRIVEIIEAAKASRRKAGRKYEVILSVGAYVIDQPQLALSALVDRAVLARKMIKGQHLYQYSFYDESIRNRQLRDKELEDRMETALAEHQFVVYFQSKFLATDATLAGAEALVRWRCGDGHLIPPGEFIPLFENNGFIVRLDLYVFQETCRLMRRWLDLGLAVKPVSVNLSRLHLYNPEFIDSYLAVLKEYSLPADYVGLELTESALFDNAAILNVLMKKLHHVGFRILMDDFGTGYSSLNMLKDMPIDVLKLDRGFLTGSDSDGKREAIIASIVGLAQSLHIRVVAEGVETEEQFQLLKRVGCDEIQGYYFAVPKQASEYEEDLVKETMRLGALE